MKIRPAEVRLGSDSLILLNSRRDRVVLKPGPVMSNNPNFEALRDLGSGLVSNGGMFIMETP